MSTRNVTVNITNIIGKSAKEIGDLLLKTSKRKDGVGLALTLEKGEELYIKRHFDNEVEKALGEMLSDALKRAEKDPKGFECYYSQAPGLFQTFPVGTFAKQAQSV